MVDAKQIGIGVAVSCCCLLIIVGIVLFLVYGRSAGGSGGGGYSGSGGGGYSGGSGGGGYSGGSGGGGSGGSGGGGSGSGCANNWECPDSEKCDNGVCVTGSRSCSTWNDCPGDLVCMGGFCGPDDGTGGSGGVEDGGTTSGGTTNGGTTYASSNNGNVAALFTGMTEKQANTALQLTSLFENSTPVLQYGYAENIGDGRGITFGFVGFCSGTCDGSQMLNEYERLKGPNSLSKYIAPMEAIDASGGCFSGSTTGLDGFIQAVGAAASDPLFIQAQLNIADKLYIGPSQAKVSQLGFSLPITQGELVDAYINHGDSGAVNMINQATSSVGTSDERAWLKKFLEIRLNVLAADSTWSSAVDRVKVYQKLLNEGNVNLDTPMTVSVYGTTFTLN